MSYYRKILQIGLPAMMENGLQMLMMVVDAYLVAQISLAAVSAVSIAANLISIYQAVFIALSAVISSLVARALVQKTPEDLSKVISQAIQLSLCLSLFMGVVSIFGGRTILYLLGASAEVGRLGATYLAWVGGSIFLLGLMISLGAVLRAKGQPRLPMYVSFLVNIVNIVLSAIAVFVFKWGILGVALGTLLSRVVGLVFLWHLLGDKSERSGWQVDWELLRLVLPVAGERLIMRVGDVLIVAFIARLGTAVLAGNAIGESLTQFTYLPAMSLSVATVILTAQSHAQNDRFAVEEIRKQSYRLSLTLMGPIAGFILLFSGTLISLFTKDSQAGQASQLLVLMSFLSLPMTAGTLIHTGLWQGLSRPKLPFYATGLGMFVFRIGLGYVLTFVFEFAFLGILMAVSLDNLFRWFFLKIIYNNIYRRNSNHETQ